MSTLLRKRFNDYMVLRNFSPKTIDAYIDAVAGLAWFYHQFPDKLSNQEIQAYLLHLIQKRKLAWSSCNVIFSGLRCFYTHVLTWDETRFHIPPRPRQHKLPMLLSVEEVNRLLNSVTNLKHRALLMTVYGAGLRVSEVVNLKPHHIESSRMLIRVEQGKGKKDRYTILPQRLLTELRDYWRAYRPVSWLFFGQDKNSPMPTGTAQKIYYKAKKDSDIKKARGIHTLRHCFATHLLDQGVDIHLIKQVLGHTALSTTSKYLHTTQKKIAQVKSPLDTFILPDISSKTEED